LRQQLGWPVDSLVVLYVGRISEAKGAADLLLAWADVQPLERSARLVLAGPAGENAQALTRGSGVEWLGPRADVAELLAAADVFVLASRQEGMPNALLEAAAAGLPAVSYTVAGARDIVADEVSGLCVPVGDVTGLAAGLRRLLTDPTCRAQMGAAARTRVVERFDVAVVAAQYRRAYTQLLTGGIPLDSHRMCT
jgi:glycosyltransferase involved in cell wall biosynthesis